MGDQDLGLSPFARYGRERLREDQIQIDPMRDSDLNDILVIEGKSFSCPWTSEMFHNEISSPVSYCRTAKMKMGGDPARLLSRILGYICFRVVCDEMEIANLAVHPRWRRGGIGHLLLKDALRWGKSKGIRRVTLEVRTSNRAAQNLYRGLGFKRVGLRKGYYQFPPEDACVMALDIARDQRQALRERENDLDKEGFLR